MRYPFLVGFILLFSSLCFSQDQFNVDLYGQFHRGDQRYSGSWAYIDGQGNEYALLGAYTGLAAYSIDNPAIEELGFIPGPPSNWREITVLGDYAYVSTEGSLGDPGMQVVDLSFLPDSLHLVTNYTNTFGRGHMIQRDIYSNDPNIYVIGTQTTQGVHIMDVTNPATPLEIGLYSPGYYIHDVHVKGNRMYAAAIFNGSLDIVDISDKTNPVLLNQIIYPSAFTHSSWLTEDNTHIIVTDEIDSLPARIFNIEDINNITEVAQYTANYASLVHNPYIKGDYCYVSHNTEGLRIIDIARADLPVEVGFYDTYTGPSGGFSGLWSACPFFPSGKIIGGNREDGLYVWTFNNAQASRIYGQVVDSLTGNPIYQADIEFTNQAPTLSSDLFGKFKWGDLPTSLEIVVSKTGYQSKTISYNFTGGEIEEPLIELVPEGYVGIQNVQINELNISPNPMHDFCLIELGTTQAESLTIYTSNGKLVKTITTKGTNFLRLERENLTTGLYYYQLKNKEGIVASGKLIVD